jgi:hypothetical protein
MTKYLIPCWTVYILLATSAAMAQDCCHRCGCHACCHKVCRVICETKTVGEVTYTCECEDFCVPGPSIRCGTKSDCDADCEGCEHCHQKPNYVPGCATVHTRKKLVRHVTQKQVPNYRWVVEYLCDGCAEKCQSDTPAAAVSFSSTKPQQGADQQVVKASAIAPTETPSPVK